MRPIPLLALLVLLTTGAAALANDKDSGPSRADLAKRIQKACRKALAHPDPDAPSPPRKPAETCACVSANLDHKLSYEELELLARSHEEDPKAGDELQKEKYFDLLDFDDLTVRSCMKDASWFYDPHRAEARGE